MSTPAPDAAPPPPPRDPYLELAQLAGHLVHEIKNHASALGLNLQLMAEDLADPETPRERRALQRALKLQHECQRLADLSGDFLRFAQLRALNRTPTRLQELTDDLLDFYGPSARQAGIDIKTFLPADLPALSLDRDLFQQGLLNLALNAVQAMPQGGTLSITAEAKGGDVHLCFIDTGVGIPTEVRDRIFDPFFTTKSAGSGLGLATLRKIVEAHGGRTLVQSEPGLGTKFTLVLPVAS